PFPYNLLLVAPFFCLAALDGAGRLRRGARGAVLGLLLVANLAGLALVVRQRPYLRYPSSFQLGFAEAAEEMTGPGEPVLDGIGLVVTRPPADRDWLIHS